MLVPGCHAICLLNTVLVMLTGPPSFIACFSSDVLPVVQAVGREKPDMGVYLKCLLHSYHSLPFELLSLWVIGMYSPSTTGVCSSAWMDLDPYLCLSGPTLYVCMSRRMTCCSSVKRDDVHVLLLMVTSFECTTKISRP